MRRSSQLDYRHLPVAGAALTALAGIVNVASALTPDIRWRGHLLLRLEGVHALQVFHALYRFNVKFQPRWNPRYLVYEGRLGLARTALAAMWAEGQLPKPRWPRAQAHVGQGTLKTANR